MDYSEELNFVFRFPTKIVFGPGTAKEAGMEVDELKRTRALIVTDRDLVQTDLVKMVQKALGKSASASFPMSSRIRGYISSMPEQNTEES